MGLTRTSLTFVAAFTLLAWPFGLRAQEAADQTAESPADRERREHETSRLVERLLSSDAEADDLAWLYSQADEYAPSGLTGEPIPTPGLPKRGEGSVRRWSPSWRKFGAGNYVLTGVGFGASAASLFVRPLRGPWRRSNELDEWGRRNLSVRAYESGQWAQDLSDLLLSFNIAFPLLVDSLIVSYWHRRSPEVAGQTALITLESMAVASLLQGPTSGFFGRERPYGRDCGKTIPDELADCAQRDRYRSFFSGHTSASFAAASVTCSHHARHDLFGDSLADGIACGTAFTTAAAVGTLRIVAQKHYVTDVFVGAVVGTLSGLGVPWLLHYGPVARVDASSDAAILWSVYPLANGMAVGGLF